MCFHNSPSFGRSIRYFKYLHFTTWCKIIFYYKTKSSQARNIYLCEHVEEVGARHVRVQSVPVPQDDPGDAQDAHSIQTSEARARSRLGEQLTQVGASGERLDRGLNPTPFCNMVLRCCNVFAGKNYGYYCSGLWGRRRRGGGGHSHIIFHYWK